MVGLWCLEVEWGSPESCLAVINRSLAAKQSAVTIPHE